MTRMGRAGVALAVMALVGLLVASSVQAAVPDRAPQAARKVKIKTTDRRPGGELEADVTWSGRGPFRARVFGTVQDLEADGQCVQAYVWRDGRSEAVGEHACPSGTVKGFRYTVRRAWRLLVRVCLTGNKGQRYCSAWS